MRFKFLIIPSVLIFQVAGAQNSSESVTSSQATVTTPAAAASSTPVMPPVSSPLPASSESTQTSIMDYKSVYETATVEDEVKMAAERFALTPSQQDIWLAAATDRRAAEKQAREKLDSKAANYEKDGVYRGLRSTHNTFYETIIGYLTPAQKQALETDRLIMQEKQKRLAKLPPPPPPAPTVTVAPVDSAAIKQADKSKKKSKKSKKKS
jgi:1,2-phenylacetyl-CoA epoxidase PaaB subunit